MPSATEGFQSLWPLQHFDRDAIRAAELNVTTGHLHPVPGMDGDLGAFLGQVVTVVEIDLCHKRIPIQATGVPLRVIKQEIDWSLNLACVLNGIHEAAMLAERLGSGDGERKTLLTRQIAFESLPASVLFALVGSVHGSGR